MKPWLFGVLVGLSASLSAEGQTAPAVTKATATIKPAAGSKVSGTVTFIQIDGGVQVVADIEGLAPGSHGFHIHEKGDCSAPDFSSAGGHFNPRGHKHGGPDSIERHVGDLGNIKADEQGKAHYDRIDSILQLNGPNTIVGRAVVVHEKADDYVSQPTGDAGARLGCGVIEVLKQ